MSLPIRASLVAAVCRLLRPLVRLLLQHGVAYGTFSDLARSVYVDVASREFGLPGRKQSVSRVAVLTGLSRKDVARLQDERPGPDDDSLGTYNRAARVVSAWVRDPAFQEPDGSPALLPLDGNCRSFSALVRRFSGDVPPRAVLDELVRVGAVEQQEDGTLRLLEGAYVPRRGHDEKLGILGSDVADLIAAIEHNLGDSTSEPYFQRKVAYDNIPQEAVEGLRRISARKAQSLLEELDRIFALHDRDANPSAAGTGRRRVMTGIYWCEEDLAAEPAENDAVRRGARRRKGRRA